MNAYNNESQGSLYEGGYELDVINNASYNESNLIDIKLVNIESSIQSMVSAPSMSNYSAGVTHMLGQHSYHADSNYNASANSYTPGYSVSNAATNNTAININAVANEHAKSAIENTSLLSNSTKSISDNAPNGKALAKGQTSDSNSNGNGKAIGKGNAIDKVDDNKNDNTTASTAEQTNEVTNVAAGSTDTTTDTTESSYTASLRSMTFQVNDASTSTNPAPAVWVTITENGDGTLTFDIHQGDGVVGDLRGVFFDVADESILNSLVINADATEIMIGNDNIKDLGNGANMNGLTGSDKGYDVGVEFGTAGIGSDDIRDVSFTVDSTARDLTLEDFANIDFGVRLTSVGMIDGSRDDSSKLLEVTFNAINTNDDSAEVNENEVTTGNLLTNDTSGLNTNDTVSITSWSGGELGKAILLDGAAGATLTVNADGSYILDASNADALAEGDVLTYTFSYTAMNSNEATSFGTDSATFTVTIYGKGGDDKPVDRFPSMLQDISNVVLYLDDGDASTKIMKVKLQPDGYSLKDVDLLNIDAFIKQYGDSLLQGNANLVAISIHAGQEYPNEALYDHTAQGEGAFFFLLDNDNPIVTAIGSKLDKGGWVSNWENDDVPLTQQAKDVGLTDNLLQEQAKIVVTNFNIDTGEWIV